MLSQSFLILAKGSAEPMLTLVDKLQAVIGRLFTDIRVKFSHGGRTVFVECRLYLI